MTRWWLLFVLPLTLLVNRAQAEYFSISFYEVNVTITPEGYADFEEVIIVNFTEPRHGIFRHIPLRSIVDGKNVTRLIENVKVEGHKFSTSKANDHLVIKIGDADKFVDGRQEYRITYRVLNPLNFFKEHSEFYWDLIGIAWEVEIGVFHVRLPEQVHLTEQDVFVYTGQNESTAQDVKPTIFPK
jgi:uncharacterized membrane protein